MSVEGAPEDTTIEDSPEGSDAALPTDTDPPLLLYRLLRDEIRLRIAINSRSLLTGLSVIGVILAYAVLSGEFVFLAVVPVVVGVLVIQTVFQLNRILFAADHLSQIERAYVDDFPLFAWEHRYGMGGAEHGVRRFGINWTLVPQGVILLLATLGYLTAIYVAYVVWPPGGVDILLIGLSRSGLLAIYVLLTVLVVIAGYSYYLHQIALPSPAD